MNFSKHSLPEDCSRYRLCIRGPCPYSKTTAAPGYDGRVVSELNEIPATFRFFANERLKAAGGVAYAIGSANARVERDNFIRHVYSLH